MVIIAGSFTSVKVVSEAVKTAVYVDEDVESPLSMSSGRISLGKSLRAPRECLRASSFWFEVDGWWVVGIIGVGGTATANIWVGIRMWISL